MTAELHAALVAAQAEMPAVEKTAKANYGKYATLDHLIAKTRSVLNTHGLAITQMPAHIDGAPALETRIVHVSGESISSTVPLVLGKQDMQSLGAALTYARRYAWSAALGIASETDDDAASTNAQPNTEARVEDSGRVTLARGWGDWTDRLAALGVPDADSQEWLRQACEAAGVASLSALDPEERKAIFNRANNVLIALSVEPELAFAPEAREIIRAAFAQAFEGAVLEGPAWRISPTELDREPRQSDDAPLGASPEGFEPTEAEQAEAERIAAEVFAE